MSHHQTGAELIAAERLRQIEKEGYTAQHDNEHEKHGQLALAAVCYAMPSIVYWGAMAAKAGDRAEGTGNFRHHFWPWHPQFWKPTPQDRVRELVKAGALIAAEIDRLQPDGHA